MTYTLWHSGVLIGETDFEGEDRDPAHKGGRRHLVGVFRPTDYGRALLPRLCGILSAMSDLKDEVVRRGLDSEDVAPDLMEELFETTSAGAHVLDIGLVVSQVELHSPSGHALEVSSMGFMDLAELAALSRRLGASEPEALDEARPDMPEFLVSVTLSGSMRAKRLGGQWRPHPWVN